MKSNHNVEGEFHGNVHVDKVEKGCVSGNQGGKKKRVL